MSNTYTKFEQLVFSMAWLSNVNATHQGNSSAELQSRAVTQISSGVPAVSDQLGYTGNNQLNLAWGPQTVNAQEQTNSGYLTQNLLFIASGPDPDNQYDKLYIVATAGTNPSSYNGWFVEDFDVGTVVPYYIPQDSIGGSSNMGSDEQGAMSQGTYNGISILGNMQSAGKTAYQYLLDSIAVDAQSGKQSRVVFTGHSLGGALAPAYAIVFKDTLLSTQNTNAVVSAYPFAGPTPGTQDFNNYVQATLDDYKAYKNNLDIVPHAWETDLLMNLGKLYVDQPTITNCNANDDGTCPSGSNCSGLPDNALVDKIAEWAIYNTNGHDYAFAQNENKTTFSGVVSMVADGRKICNSAHKEAKDLYYFRWLDKAVAHTYNDINAIYQHTPNASGNIGIEDLTAFLEFLSVAGVQHTTAYLNELLDADTITLLQSYFAGEKQLSELLDIVDTLLDEVVAYLNK